MNRKHATTILLSLLLVIALIAGCGQSATPPATSSPASAGEASAEATTDASQSAETSTEPSAELAPMTLKYYWPCGPQKEDAQALVQEEVNKFLTGKINTELELNPVDWGIWFEKYPVILASGEQADIMFSASWSGYVAEAGKNSFLEVTDLLKEYGSGITDGLAPEFLKAATIKGKIFAVPQNKDAAQGYALYLQKDIVEKAGVKVEDIKALDDLEPILEYVKNNEKDMIPLATTLDAGAMYVCTRDGYADGIGDFSKYEGGYDQWGSVIVYDRQNSKFVSLDPTVSKAWVSYGKMMQRYNEKGYLMKDILTNKSVDAGKLWAEGKTWMTTSSDVPGQLELIAGSVKKEVVQVNMLPSVKNTNSLIGSLLAIPRSAKDPARSMMVINLMHTEKDLVNLLVNGVEGKNYVKIDDNNIRLPDGVASKDDTGWNPGSWWMVGNAFLNYVWDTDLPNRWGRMQEFNKNSPVSDIVGFNFDSSTVKTEVAAVTNAFEQYKRLVMTGSGDTEKYVTEMFDKMKAAGLEKIVEEYNKQLVEWKATAQ